MSDRALSCGTQNVNSDAQDAHILTAVKLQQIPLLALAHISIEFQPVNRLTRTHDKVQCVSALQDLAGCCINEQG